MVEDAVVSCPFCGEEISVTVDCSEEDQIYVEDCSVCCRPINFHVRCSESELASLNVSR